MARSLFKHCLLQLSKESTLNRHTATMTTVAIVNSKIRVNHNNQNSLRQGYVTIKASFSTNFHLRQFESKDHEHAITVNGNSQFHSITNLYLQQQMLKLQDHQQQKQQQHKEKNYYYKVQFEADINSDDECEHTRPSLHHERGDSEFWRRKMRTLHRILDVNRDGVISFDDFDLFTKRFISLGHLSTQLAKEFKEVMTQTWIEQFGPIQPYNLITAEQFLTDLHHRLNDEDMCKSVGLFLPYLFKAVDYDHTGHLDINQYKLFFNCLGLSDEDAAISFAVIDKNGDGEISLQEFVHLGRQYFFTEDDTKISKMFWGPLISDH